MSGISGIYILDKKGKVLVQRRYRSDIPQSTYDVFNKAMKKVDEITMKPIFTEKGLTFMFTKYSNITFMAVTKRNSNATLVFTFLYKLIEIFKGYFNEIDDDSIKDNFVIIYELLDEMMDNGYPQTTEFKILKQFIKSDYHQVKGTQKQKESQLQVPTAISRTVSWRPEGITHPKNEVFLDVMEKLNIVVSANGNVIKSEILGTLQMKCYLNGMPELKLGLNDKTLFEISGRTTRSKLVDLDDIKFHQCVRLAKFENERVITFIPPDGDCSLVTYRLDLQVKPLFMIEVVVEKKSRTRLEYYVKAKANFKARSVANNVEILIPVPSDTQQPTFKTVHGKVSYKASKDSLLWEIKQFQGQREMLMKASLKLPTIESEERDNYRKIPVSINFEIPYFTVSGIQVRYLKIMEKSGYKASPWVRYITQSGSYQIRTGL